MKKMLLAIVALLACHTMQAQYFCTTNGTELHYVNYDEAGQSLSNETVTVYNGVNNASGASAQYLAKIVTNKTKTIPAIRSITGATTAMLLPVRRI